MTTEITSRNVKRYLRAVARREALKREMNEAIVEMETAVRALTGGQLAQAERVLKADENPYSFKIAAREHNAAVKITAEGGTR